MASDAMDGGTMMDREQLVRERAYVIWDTEGRPAGREQEHWDRAVREINEQEPEDRKSVV